ncbi:hypothetical protein NEOLI_003622 [Neolecta irregularis DAH-3]|uniref:Uncharacterized protein n=1 Tax=Neolecta irregularis (strain DAH-3) TaxID=1198029 RepID=A0A1U7LH73_NEOID|nr:hypothetical protein NEOLI_003622 [Neolecta irregularis DAH-3]|eukprot:OLL22006.1 hypothetical protein NEOLI_003622 [Neolecta irregularis DAH-3]
MTTNVTSDNYGTIHLTSYQQDLHFNHLLVYLTSSCDQQGWNNTECFEQLLRHESQRLRQGDMVGIVFGSLAGAIVLGLLVSFLWSYYTRHTRIHRAPHNLRRQHDPECAYDHAFMEKKAQPNPVVNEDCQVEQNARGHQNTQSQNETQGFARESPVDEVCVTTTSASEMG